MLIRSRIANVTHSTNRIYPYLSEDRAVFTSGSDLFVAEFDFKQDMERALGGSPWVVGKHAVILCDYDENLEPSEI